MNIIVYSSNFCGFCVRAKSLLDRRGLPYQEVVFDMYEVDVRPRLEELTGGTTFPQIVIDGKPIGGYAELVELERAGRLDHPLAA
jgi:glutaredoxin 3